jgi:hypothetical protein
VLTITGAAVADVGGIPMAADSKTLFHILSGDANGDRKVNDLDLYRVWQNQLKQPANRDANEDLNSDGQVDAADLKPVEDNFLKSLPAQQSAGSNHGLVSASAVATNPAPPVRGAPQSSTSGSKSSETKALPVSVSSTSSEAASNPALEISIEPWQLAHARAISGLISLPEADHSLLSSPLPLFSWANIFPTSLDSIRNDQQHDAGLMLLSSEKGVSL